MMSRSSSCDPESSILTIPSVAVHHQLEIASAMRGACALGHARPLLGATRGVVHTRAALPTMLLDYTPTSFVGASPPLALGSPLTLLADDGVRPVSDLTSNPIASTYLVVLAVLFSFLGMEHKLHA